MKYYTLSFRNKILLALILILVACLGVIFGKTFNDNNTITADASSYNYVDSNNVGASGVPSKTNGTAYDWIQLNGGDYVEVSSVTLIKFYNGTSDSDFVYGSYFSSLSTNLINSVYYYNSSGTAVTFAESVSYSKGSTNIRDYIKNWSLLTLVNNSSCTLTKHTSGDPGTHSGNIYHTTYFPYGSSYASTNVFYDTGRGTAKLALNMSNLANALCSGSTTDSSKTAYYEFHVKTYGANGWSTEETCSSLSSLMTSYSIPNSYKGVYFDSGYTSWNCKKVEGGADLNADGQIKDPTEETTSSRYNTGCYVNDGDYGHLR